MGGSAAHSNGHDIGTKKPASMQDNETCDRCSRKLKVNERVIEIVERSHIRAKEGEGAHEGSVLGEKLLGRFCKICERLVLAQVRLSVIHRDAITLALSDNRVRQHLVPLWCALPAGNEFNHIEIEWVDKRSLLVTLNDLTGHRSSHYTFDVRTRALSPVAKRRK